MGIYYLSADSIFREGMDVEKAADMARKVVENMYN
tara:strand:+ start:427 stop:531 length:105 start_codon:yes stop_codon:yes gene_type:complete